VKIVAITMSQPGIDASDPVIACDWRPGDVRQRPAG